MNKECNCDVEVDGYDQLCIKCQGCIKDGKQKEDSD